MMIGDSRGKNRKDSWDWFEFYFSKILLLSQTKAYLS